MAALADKYPDCVVDFPLIDGTRVPSIDYRCVKRHLKRDGRVIDSVAGLEGLKLVRYMEFDQGDALIKAKGKGWFYIPDGKPHVKFVASGMI